MTRHVMRGGAAVGIEPCRGPREHTDSRCDIEQRDMRDAREAYTERRESAVAERLSFKLDLQDETSHFAA